MKLKNNSEQMLVNDYRDLFIHIKIKSAHKYNL